MFFLFELACLFWVLLMPRGMWDLLPPGINPLHWELRVLTTGPPGKS